MKQPKTRTFICEGCGNPCTIPDHSSRKNQTFCGHKCAARGERNARYKGGSLNYAGYVVVRPTPGQQKMQHVIIAEAVLGKELPMTAEVHHFNEVKSDNRNQNLVICENAAYHQLLHARQRIVAAGGDPNTEKVCGKCRQVRPRSEFYRNKHTFDGLTYKCSECDRADSKTYRDSKLIKDEL